MKKDLAVAYGMKKRNGMKMSAGGMACMSNGGMVDSEDIDSMVGEIMKKKIKPSDEAIDDMGGGGPEVEAYSKSGDDLLAWESDFDASYPDNNNKGNEDQEMARKKERLAAAIKDFRSRC